MKRLLILFSAGLLVSFFMPWLEVLFVSFGGYEIPSALKSLNSVANVVGAGSSLVYLGFLLWLVPLMSVLDGYRYVREKSYFIINEFWFGLIFSVGIMVVLIYLFGISALYRFGAIGLYITLSCSVCGLLLISRSKTKA